MIQENNASEATEELSEEAFLDSTDLQAKRTDELPKAPSEVKKITQELLRYGYLEESQKRDLFQAAIHHQKEVSAVLDPLDLELRLDTHRGVAFLRVAPVGYDNSEEDAAWLHPLVRRQRLTLEQPLLVAILRQVFVVHEQESGVGQGEAKIALDDLLPQFTAFFGDSGSDAKNDSRLSSLLDQLKPHGIVSEVDKKQEVTIRPLIAYLANPESLMVLLKVLKSHGHSSEIQEQNT
jgi:hypothetical protein